MSPHLTDSTPKLCAFCRGQHTGFDGKPCVACDGMGYVVARVIGNGRDIQIIVEEPAYGMAPAR